MTVSDSDDALSRDSAAMAIGTVLSRLTGFGRVLALLYVLGAGRLADSYTLANTVPNALYDLVLGGVLSATLIPVFVDQLATREDDDAWDAISAVVTVAVGVLAVMTIVFAVAAPWIIRLYTVINHTPSAADERAVATYLLRLFSPQILLLGVIALTAAALNARRSFRTPMFTPIANNLFTIAVILVFPHIARTVRLASLRHDHRALLFLGLGTTAGYLVQVVLQVPALRRAGVRLHGVWRPRADAVRRVVRLSGWTAGVVITNQIAFAISLVLVGGHDGGVVAFTTAYMFFQLPYAIFAVSVSTALLPELATTWSQGRTAEFRERLSLGLRTTIAFLVPSAVGYVLLAAPVIVLVAQHGLVTPHAARTIGTALAYFAIGLPGFSAYLFLMKAYQAMQDTRSMFAVYLAENAINVVLALALYPTMGVNGVVLAFSLAYSIAAFGAFADLRRRLGRLDGGSIAASSLRVCIASALLATAVLGARRLLGDGVTGMVCCVVAGGTVYLGGARLLGIDELATVLRIRRRSA